VQFDPKNLSWLTNWQELVFLDLFFIGNNEFLNSFHSFKSLAKNECKSLSKLNIVLDVLYIFRHFLLTFDFNGLSSLGEFFFDHLQSISLPNFSQISVLDVEVSGLS
jgi:hypothetical protein